MKLFSASRERRARMMDGLAVLLLLALSAAVGVLVYVGVLAVLPDK